MAITKVPGSLGDTPFTAVPMYLQLYVLPTNTLNSGDGQWREIKISDFDSASSYILPPPKIGMGQGTHSENMDDVQFWQVSSVGDKARMILGDTIFYGVSKALGYFGMNGYAEANYDYMVGGSRIPPDLSAMQYKGMRKRAYNFSFELFAYTQADHQIINDFCTNMHKSCMPQAKVTSPGGISTKTIYTPSVFWFKILRDDNGAYSTAITNSFFVDPKPCTMIGFNSSAVDYMAIDSTYNRPSRIAINMIMSEIEPVVVNNGNVKSLFEVT